MYITKVKNGVSKNGAPFLLHKSNGELVYCIEPFLYMDESTYYGYKSKDWKRPLKSVWMFTTLFTTNDGSDMHNLCESILSYG